MVVDWSDLKALNFAIRLFEKYFPNYFIANFQKYSHRHLIPISKRPRILSQSIAIAISQTNGIES